MIFSGFCGGIFNDAIGHISSPNYPQIYQPNLSGKYPGIDQNVANCIYTISQPTGTVILLNFLSMDIGDRGYDHCNFDDYLEIRDGSSAHSPFLKKLCGNSISASIQSSQNQLWMRWRDISYVEQMYITINWFNFRFYSGLRANGNGFQIQYKPLQLFKKCGGNYSNASGVLSSPLHPYNYPDLVDCVYLISQPIGTYVKISFISMDIDCQGTSTDFIGMRDGHHEDSPQIARFCGNGSNVPDFIQTTQNQMRIR